MNNSGRFEAFIDAAIRKTKTGLLSWERVDTKKFRPENWPDYDVSRSFVCSYGIGQMLLTYDTLSGTPHCYISPDKGLPFQRIAGPEEDDGTSLVLRLYNLVYSAFPSVDSFIDAMINSADDFPF